MDNRTMTLFQQNINDNDNDLRFDKVAALLKQGTRTKSEMFAELFGAHSIDNGAIGNNVREDLNRFYALASKIVGKCPKPFN